MLDLRIMFLEEDEEQQRRSEDMIEARKVLEKKMVQSNLLAWRTVIGEGNVVQKQQEALM